MQYLFLPLLLLAMYFLVIRPQQQRIKAQQAVVAAVEEGDEVVTSAGIYGRITELDDEVATLEVADGVEIRIARGAIARRLPSPDDDELQEFEDDVDGLDDEVLHLDEEADEPEEIERTERDEPGGSR